jgi:hypothetical protein
MRKFLTSVSIFLVCGMMFCPITEGQNRGRNGGDNPGNNSRNVTTQQRPGNMGKGNSSSNNRTGNSGKSSNNRQNIGNNNNNRPNNGGQVSNNNRPAGMNPGNGGWNTHSPNMGGARPGGNMARPNMGGSGHGGFKFGAPMRPYMPANHRWYRPTPPPSFRPYRGCPRFSSILGIALGSALNYSLDCLVGAGYNVLGYVADAIYLSNVSMLNMMWPNATMHYSGDVLRGSEFTYSTPGYDRSRYTMTYNSLVRQYGAPISVQNNGNDGISATWWGYDNNYVTLSFYPDYAYNGAVRYYTTLSFGN